MDRKQPVPPARNPSFSKVLIGDFTKQLKIPPAYVNRVECFNGASWCKLSCILRRRHANPDKLWHVYVEMVDNHFCFHKGWDDFVRDNSLEFGDFLLFRHAGNLHFAVEIYDTTCYEKEVPTQENNNCKSTGPVVKRNTGPVTRSKTADVISTNHGHGENQVQASFFQNSNWASPFAKWIRDFLTHMKRRIQNVKIEASDNSWEVRLLPASSRRRLSGGWTQCARDNSLQLGDVCVFRLINKNDSVLKLSIFRNNMRK